MHAHKIFQIFYDDETERSLDSGFIPLDNSGNERPDWSEYWPIRNYLLNNLLDDETYYGFLSPKFKLKTRLTSIDVHEYLSQTDVDVVSFSPFFDQMTFPFNPFEQASFYHEGSYPTILDAFGFLEPNFSIDRKVMTSSNTIFCNYFAAKKPFWLQWFDYCERLFNEAENNTSDLALRINSFTGHAYKMYPAKVFIMERVASFVLLMHKHFKVQTHNPINRPFGEPVFNQYKQELIQMDALKKAYVETGSIDYLEVYCSMRNEIVRKTHK